jgi:hypothetical protein
VLKAVSGTAEHKIAADGIEVLLLLRMVRGGVICKNNETMFISREHI